MLNAMVYCYSRAEYISIVRKANRIAKIETQATDAEAKEVEERRW